MLSALVPLDAMLLAAGQVEVGGYINPWKILPPLVLLFVWGRLLTWIDKDTDAALRWANQLADPAEQDAALAAIRTTAPVGIGASLAMKDGFKQGKPILLEPIMRVENITPDEYQGDICGDLSRRRGSIQSIETRGNMAIIHSEVPLAELFGYATAIRSLSKGRSSYSMEPSHFEPVPANLVAAILDQKETK